MIKINVVLKKRENIVLMTIGGKWKENKSPKKINKEISLNKKENVTKNSELFLYYFSK